MSIDEKRNALIHLYHVLEEIHEDRSSFCHQGCSDCCTQHITMTSLEGYHLFDYLIQSTRHNATPHLFLSEQRHHPPPATINTWAKRCAENNEMVEDGQTADTTPAVGVCPLLAEHRCTVYPARPLACRIMISQKDCRLSGLADMKSVDVTINNVMMQFVEHIDQNGLTGHMFDIMTYLFRADHRHTYESTGILDVAPGLLQNQPLTVLMVPPEHRPTIGPVLHKLNPAMEAIF